MEKGLKIGIALNNVFLVAVGVVILWLAYRAQFWPEVQVLWTVDSWPKTIGAFVVGITISLGLLWLVIQLKKADLPDTNGSQFILELMQMKGTPFFVIALLPAFVEEFLFRGAIQHVLQQKWSLLTSLLITALLFTLVHIADQYKGQYYILALVLILGLLLGVQYAFTGNLWASVLTHFAYNSMSIIWMRKGYVRIRSEA